MNIAIITLLFIVELARGSNLNSLKLINSEGSIRSITQVLQFVSSARVPDGPIAVLAILDLTSGGSTALVKELVDVDLNEANNSVTLQISAERASLAASYTQMYGSKFSGVKVTDFFSAVANSIVVVLPARGLEEVLQSHDQALRRIAQKISSGLDGRLQSVIFLVDTSASPSAPLENISGLIQNQFSALYFDTVGKEFKDSEPTRVSVLTASVADPASLEAMRDSLSSVRGSSTGPSFSSLVDAWADASAVSRPVLSSAQRQSLFKVESAYTMAITQADSVIDQWRERVYQGKIVGKFGDRVAALLNSVTDLFLERTLGSVVVRDRSERLGQLKTYIGNAARALFQQQLVILSGDITRRFQKDLLQLAASGLQSSDEEQQLLRMALFSFRALATDLEVESFGFKSDPAQAELSEDLKKLVADFPESPSARLVEIQRVEKDVKRPSRRKGSRALNVGLSLVGMLRPPGFGSFQGYAGYNTALFGLPFDILMGVQNDGDSAEVMGEDREHPILRLQPKFNFEIDL